MSSTGIAFLATSALMLTACASDDADPMNGPVAIRACNASGQHFSTFRYYEGGETSAPLANGACTDYVRPDQAIYSYTGAQFTVGADEFGIAPVDFVGETPLEAGSWSYQVTITDYAAREVSISAVRD